MYVTLEPCSHHGRTPPCADALIAAGVRRVVMAIEDPDPRVAGRGTDRLRAAGIEVIRSVGAAEADWITRGHILRVTERRPLVQLKMALGPDGSVPRGTGGRPVFVTRPAARAHAHLMRAEADAIMVGAGTLLDDDPELTCRLPGAGGRSPVRVVLSAGGAVAPIAKVVSSARQVATWLVAGPQAPAERLEPLRRAGVRVLEGLLVAGRLWLPQVLELLAAEGITRLLVEGGPQLWAAFARARIVDELAVIVAGAAAAGGPEKAALPPLPGIDPAALGLAVVSRVALGDDVLITLRASPPRARHGHPRAGA